MWMWLVIAITAAATIAMVWDAWTSGHPGDAALIVPLMALVGGIAGLYVDALT